MHFHSYVLYVVKVIIPIERANSYTLNGTTFLGVREFWIGFTDAPLKYASMQLPIS